jgi:hypothetical protein
MTTQTISALDDLLAAVGDGTVVPPWLFVLSRHIAAWDDACDAYIMAVHHHARPVLNDMERLTAPK